MNIAIGLFEGETALQNGVRKVLLQGIKLQDMSVLSPHQKASYPVEEPVDAKGFLEEDIKEEGSLISALQKYNFGIWDISAYIEAVGHEGYKILLIRVRQENALPWVIEAMHRALAFSTQEINASPVPLKV